MSTLEQRLEEDSKIIEETFAKHGELHPPRWTLERPNGELVIVDTPYFGDTMDEVHECKDTVAVTVRLMVALEKAKTVSYMSEAWQLIINNAEQARSYVPGMNLSEHPDRHEVVLLTVAERDGCEITAQWPILRPEHGPPKLAPRKIMPEPERKKGRFTHIFNPPPLDELLRLAASLKR